MPSSLHTTLVDFLEAHPEALAYLLELAGQPPDGPLRITTGTGAKTFILERRVNRAYLVGSGDSPSAFLLAEVQLEPDDDKRLSWSLYVELARTRHGCEGALVVLTVSERVRRWIRRHIVPATGRYGCSRQLKPRVIALDAINPALLLRPDRPYLAPLAVAGRVASPDVDQVAETAVDITLGRLSKRLAADQLDAILGMVNEALRARLEKRIMVFREPQSPLFRSIYLKEVAQGRAKGLAKGLAEGLAKGTVAGHARAILAVLEARGIPVSDHIRDRILGCSDVATLDAWVRRAVTALTAASVVRTKAPVPIPRTPARRPRKR